MIVNEDFADNMAVLVDKIEKQLGDGHSVKGVSAFFLVTDPEGLDRWMVISNYVESLSDSNMLYLHQSVARHLSMDFSGISYGPEGGARQ